MIFPTSLQACRTASKFTWVSTSLNIFTSLVSHPLSVPSRVCQCHLFPIICINPLPSGSFSASTSYLSPGRQLSLLFFGFALVTGLSVLNKESPVTQTCLCLLLVWIPGFLPSVCPSVCGSSHLLLFLLVSCRIPISPSALVPGYLASLFLSVAGTGFPSFCICYSIFFLFLLIFQGSNPSLNSNPPPLADIFLYHVLLIMNLLGHPSSISLSLRSSCSANVHDVWVVLVASFLFCSFMPSNPILSSPTCQVPFPSTNSFPQVLGQGQWYN